MAGSMYETSCACLSEIRNLLTEIDCERVEDLHPSIGHMPSQRLKLQTMEARAADT